MKSFSWLLGLLIFVERLSSVVDAAGRDRGRVDWEEHWDAFLVLVERLMSGVSVVH